MTEVASGLAARGHEVHVVALEGRGVGDETFTLHPSPMALEHRMFRWTARRGVARLLARLEADAVMERYYNFGGEGVRAAHDLGIPVTLEVNSPLAEPSGSFKSKLDRLLVVRPMAKLRDEICRKVSAFITPLPSIIPEHVPRAKIHRVSWGANVVTFHPGIAKKDLPIPNDRDVVVFSGSFRPWHGADILVRAAVKLPRAFFLFIGDGPALSRCRALAKELGLEGRILFTGAVPYEEVASYLRWADVGVAPYQPGRLGQMKLGFYWSPLKIFEYMAVGAPVVTLNVPPLAEIVRSTEGALVPEGDPDALAKAIGNLLGDETDRQSMARAARDRVVEHYSWQKHCEALERILTETVAR